MPNWKQIIGLNFTPDTFDTYCRSLQWTTWKPSFIVLHNTSSPTLAQRPEGLTTQHIQNLVSYYRDEKKWSAGPHLFIDDRQIHAFTPLTTPGVHSPSWNAISLGIEMVGEYETESFSTGRGLQVRKNTIAAIASLSAVLGLNPTSIRFHKEDAATNHRTCPGKNVIKSEIITEVTARIQIKNIVETRG